MIHVGEGMAGHCSAQVHMGCEARRKLFIGYGISNNKYPDRPVYFPMSINHPSSLLLLDTRLPLLSESHLSPNRALNQMVTFDCNFINISRDKSTATLRDTR